jgi:hypothetical protein
VLQVIKDVAAGQVTRETKARATWLLLEVKQARAKKLKRSLPRRKAGQAAAASAALRRAELRGKVFERAAGRCECCASKSPSEMHHLVSGPSRRARESLETCAAVCAWCHVDLHKGRKEALLRLRDWALGLNFAEAMTALDRRLDKIEEAHP